MNVNEIIDAAIKGDVQAIDQYLPREGQFGATVEHDGFQSYPSVVIEARNKIFAYGDRLRDAGIIIATLNSDDDLVTRTNKLRITQYASVLATYIATLDMFRQVMH